MPTLDFKIKNPSHFNIFKSISAFGPRPSDGCSYEVFNYFTKELIENATAIYQAKPLDIMKLSNVKNEMPYSLKFNGNEKTKFYLLTNKSHEEDDQIESICYSDNKTKTITLKTPHRFWSYFFLEGELVKNIKIDDVSYEIANKPQESGKIIHNLTILAGYFE